jgi:hypothetical protein
MGTASAIPEHLYSYADKCCPVTHELVSWVQSVLGPAIDAYLSGTTPQGGANPDATVDLSAVNSLISGGRYASGSLKTELRNALTLSADTDTNVKIVGVAFEQAGSGGAFIGPVLPGRRPLVPYHLDDATLDGIVNDPQYWTHLQVTATTGSDARLRDQANRLLLEHDFADLHRQLDAAQLNPALNLPKTVLVHYGKTQIWVENKERAAADQQITDLRKKIDEVKGIQRALATGDGQVPHYLLQYDLNGPRGHAVIASGDPYAASTRNIVTQVFGMTTEVSGMYGDVIRSDRVVTAAGSLDSANPTAVVTWYGYDAPRVIPDHADVLFTAEGKLGAAALSQFQAQLVALHQGPPAHMTVIAHSYGGVITGYAALQPGGLHAQDVVYVGSVGTPADGLKAMQNSGAYVWTARYGNDVARATTGVSKLGTLLETVDPVLGVEEHLFFNNDSLTTQLADPNSTLGVTHLSTGQGVDTGDLKGDPIASHGHYWDDPIALRNLAAVSTGKLTPRTPTPVPGQMPTPMPTSGPTSAQTPPPPTPMPTP